MDEGIQAVIIVLAVSVVFTYLHNKVVEWFENRKITDEGYEKFLEDLREGRL